MKQIQQIFDNAEQLFSMVDIEQALDKLAIKLTEHFSQTNPVLLCVMKGSVITAGHLLPKLTFSLELDYIHVTRYGDKTVGGKLVWLHQPAIDLTDRTVILIEDIFDVGLTLQSLRDYCMQAGAKSVSCVTLINKLHDNKLGLSPEFIGLTVPDRYVFGFGMDYKGYWRNAPGIYAVRESDL
ncbi:MAG: hypoxanthine-guanine phosphoribosyltransferase [Methylophaga sp.]|nr:MAG: hypoxanthine-guanine phosphoribosyltransferase [Methylophaga sp.]